MESGNLAQWVALAVSVATTVFSILSVRTRAAADKVTGLETKLADKASQGRVGAVEERASQMETRLTSLEGELRHLPSRDQTHKMEIALEKMNGQLQVMAERLGPVASTSERLQEFLLQEAQAKRTSA